MQEHVVLVNERNESIGTAPKSTVHTANTPLHRAFSVFLFNQGGQLLIQQRSRHKQTWPLVWSNSCCGHPLPDEETVAAAQKRVAWELGIFKPKLLLAEPDYKYRAEKDGIVEHEICPILVGLTSYEPVINENEIEMIDWISWDDFENEIEKSKLEFSPWCIEEAKILRNNKILKGLLG